MRDYLTAAAVRRAKGSYDPCLRAALAGEPAVKHRKSDYEPIGRATPCPQTRISHVTLSQYATTRRPGQLSPRAERRCVIKLAVAQLYVAVWRRTGMGRCGQ